MVVLRRLAFVLSAAAAVLALSAAIHDRTKTSLPADRLPWLERIEATPYFNVGTGLALEHGFYGVEGHDVLGPCGTMTRVLLKACWRIGVPARKLQLLPGPTMPAGTPCWSSAPAIAGS